MGRRANPAFAVGVVAVSLVALGYALTVATIQQHTYVHVMAGVLWTGVDVFMGTVLGPVVGGLDDEESAAFFQRLTPKTAFFLPAMAFVTIGSGLPLAIEKGFFEGAAAPWLALFTAANVIPILLLVGYRLDVYRDWRWQTLFAVAAVGSLAWVATTVGQFEMISHVMVAALAIVTLLSVQGFGFLMPGEIRMYREMTSSSPDASIIASIGKQNAMLGGVQGLFQLILVALMVSLRYGLTF
ncbi:MAG: hypothetical protein ABEJ68_03850 [Halobacteriaceae archaeon]